MKTTLLIPFLIAASLFAADAPPPPAKPATPASSPLAEVHQLRIQKQALEAENAQLKAQLADKEASIARYETRDLQDQRRAEIQSICKEAGIAIDVCAVNMSVSKEHPVPTVDQAPPAAPPPSAEAKPKAEVKP